MRPTTTSTSSAFAIRLQRGSGRQCRSRSRAPTSVKGARQRPRRRSKGSRSIFRSKEMSARQRVARPARATRSNERADGVIPRIDFETLRFESPALLWLLVVPAALAVLWIWRVVRRRADVHRLKASRILPVRERYNFAGDLTFWLTVLVAATLCIVAVAKPQARVSAARRASLDIVLLQDASASMHVNDVRPD